MHLPDHYLSDLVRTTTGVLAVIGLAAGTYFARRRLSAPGSTRWTTPVVGAAIFALQMLNYPIDASTSGHVLGGLAAALLVGPMAAMWLLSTVLAVQAFAFGDGGVYALGANVLNMAVVGVWSGWAVWRLTNRLGTNAASQCARAGLAGWASVQCEHALLRCGSDGRWTARRRLHRRTVPRTCSDRHR
ncbi:MAG: energy-coupling factor ABC transporter permease [Pirellulales bacterium]